MLNMVCSLQVDVKTMYVSSCGKSSKHPKNRMEQHFQDVDQKVQYNKNPDTFAAYLSHYLDQKQTHNSVVKYQNTKSSPQ